MADGKVRAISALSCVVAPPTPSPHHNTVEISMPAFLKVNPLYPSSDLLHTILAVCHPVLRQDGTMLGGASGLDGDRDSAEAAQVITAKGICLDEAPPLCWLVVAVVTAADMSVCFRCVCCMILGEERPVEAVADVRGGFRADHLGCSLCRVADVRHHFALHHWKDEIRMNCDVNVS